MKVTRCGKARRRGTNKNPYVLDFQTLYRVTEFPAYFAHFFVFIVFFLETVTIYKIITLPNRMFIPLNCFFSSFPHYNRNSCNSQNFIQPNISFRHFLDGCDTSLLVFFTIVILILMTNTMTNTLYPPLLRSLLRFRREKSFS